MHVCMMCISGATDSFGIKAAATSRHNLWHNLRHVWSMLNLVVLELLDVACYFATHPTLDFLARTAYAAKFPDPFCVLNEMHVIMM